MQIRGLLSKYVQFNFPSCVCFVRVMDLVAKQVAIFVAPAILDSDQS